MKKPELLAPAGTFEKAKVAFMYGADAVYAGTNKLSLRTRTSMQFDDLVNALFNSLDAVISEVIVIPLHGIAQSLCGTVEAINYILSYDESKSLCCNECLC